MVCGWLLYFLKNKEIIKENNKGKNEKKCKKNYKL
jgi:hypothetical protein